MSRLTEVQSQLEKLRLEEARLSAARFKEKILPVITASIGKTYVYRNNSSGGESAKWDVFRRLKAVEFSEYHAWVVYEECELRADNGFAGLRTATELYSQSYSRTFPSFETGWTPCEEQEYLAARVCVIEQLENPTMECEILRETVR